MYIDKIYLKDYFSNIIDEKWLFSGNSEKFSTLNGAVPARIGTFNIYDPVQKKSTTFDYNQIEVLIFDETFKEVHYLIGKCPLYFFLAIRKDEDEYPWVTVIKHSTLAPIIKEITHFKEMFPNVKAGDFANKLLLSNKLSDELYEKEVEPKKISKI